MAKRKVRKKKNQPHLRTGGGRAAKAARSQERHEHVESTTDAGPKIRMRPAGGLGFAYMTLLGWLAAAIVVGVGLMLGRWNVMSYPDSLWLYAAFGALVAAAGVGRLSRTQADADSWGIQALLVPLGLFVAEWITGPSCPTGAQCSAIGARGSMGIVLSVLLILVLGAAAWMLSRWMFTVADRSRARHGQVRYRFAFGLMVAMFIFPGLFVAASLVGFDLLLRSTPGIAKTAMVEVERECYGISEAPPLAIRAAPQGYNSQWTTFAVRRADESRPGIGKKGKLPSNWATHDSVHPYEATVSFNQTGALVSVSCGRIGPGSGNAVEDDLKAEEPANNPLSPTQLGQEFYPRFFTQGVAGPTEEGKALIEKLEKEAAKTDKKDGKAADKTDKDAKKSKPKK